MRVLEVVLDDGPFDGDLFVNESGAQFVVSLGGRRTGQRREGDDQCPIESHLAAPVLHDSRPALALRSPDERLAAITAQISALGGD